MQRYFEQLTEDIQEAAQRRPGGTVHSGFVPEDVREQFPGAEFLHSQPIGQWFGLDREQFPPASRWTEEQLRSIVELLRALYDHYNYELALHENMPDAVCYEALVKGLDMPEAYHAECRQHIYFCERNSRSCPFGEYCDCERWGE